MTSVFQLHVTFPCTNITNVCSMLLQSSQMDVGRFSSNLSNFSQINVKLILLDSFSAIITSEKYFTYTICPPDLWIWFQEFMGLSSESDIDFNILLLRCAHVRIKQTFFHYSFVFSLRYGFEQVVDHLNYFFECYFLGRLQIFII